MKPLSFLQNLLSNKSYTLKNRLFLFFSVLIFVMLLCLFVFLFIFEELDAPQRNISLALQNYAESYEKSVSWQLNTLSAYAVNLSKDISHIVERSFQENGISFSEFKNNKHCIYQLEKQVSQELKTALLISKSSGAFVTFDISMNEDTNKHPFSRSGVYLKITNISSVNDANPTIFLFRGVPSIASDFSFELHNHWDLEFDVSGHEKEFLYLATHANKFPPKSYFLSLPFQFKNTWEKALLMTTPIVGSEGEFYGLSGFEVSGLLYNLSHRHIISPAKDMAGILAWQGTGFNQKPEFHVDMDFSHGAALPHMNDEKPLRVEEGEYYNTYHYGQEVFVGLEKDMRIFPETLMSRVGQWKVLALYPKAKLEELIFKNYAIICASILLFILVTTVLSYYFVHRYATPILNIIRKVKNSEHITTHIDEFDELIDFFRAKEKKLREQLASTQSGLPQDKLELVSADISAYRTFIEQLETLTKAERAVFELYSQGHTAHEAALTLKVSINTIRTHNRNIYGKLYVSSYKELMVYTKMMMGNSTDEG